MYKERSDQIELSESPNYDKKFKSAVLIVYKLCLAV